jgi:hypothetical protein
VFSPDKPVSMFFDACVAIDQGGYGGIGCGCGCGGLTWERAYPSNEKYTCTRDNSWSWWCRFLLLLPLLELFHELHGKGQNMQPSFTRGQLPQTALLGPVILKISLYLSHLISHRDM